MELCCTRALLGQLGEEAGPPQPAQGKLSYWTCKGIVYERKRYVLALNKETMLTLLVRGAPGASLRERLAASLEAGLGAFGVSEADALAEGALMRAASFGKNRDRSLLGSLNDHAFSAPLYMDSTFDGTLESLLVISEKLSRTPHVKRDPVWAKESIAALFDL